MRGSREAVYGSGPMRGHGEYTELSPHVRAQVLSPCCSQGSPLLLHPQEQLEVKVGLYVPHNCKRAEARTCWCPALGRWHLVSCVLGSMVPCFGEVALDNVVSGVYGICGKQDEAVTSLCGVAEGHHLTNT